jgi:hypothetical protein
MSTTKLFEHVDLQVTISRIIIYEGFLALVQASCASDRPALMPQNKGLDAACRNSLEPLFLTRLRDPPAARPRLVWICSRYCAANHGCFGRYSGLSRRPKSRPSANVAHSGCRYVPRHVARRLRTIAPLNNEPASSGVNFVDLPSPATFHHDPSTVPSFEKWL